MKISKNFRSSSYCDIPAIYIWRMRANLAFSYSLRIGELMGLTWDCVDIDEESIKNKNASIYIDKQLQRVSKNSLEKLDNKDVIKVFPSVLVSDSTALVLKSLKRGRVFAECGFRKRLQGVL